MTTQIERACTLKNLHIKGDPLILYNIWDAGGAKALQEVGAKAIATGSWSVAAAHGYDDGEKIPFDLVLENFKRIIESTDLPVTVDLEGGYGQSPLQVQETALKVIEVGVAGINFEDQIVGTDELYSIEDQCSRIKAIREGAERALIPLFINSRTDIFLKTDPLNHTDDHLNEAIRRSSAYAESGANGFFIPGLRDGNYIEKLCALSPIPINVMIMPGMPTLEQLSEMGVARISYGPGPYCLVMNALEENARQALSKER